MTEYVDSVDLSVKGGLLAETSLMAALQGSASLRAITGLLTRREGDLTYVQKYVGEEKAPQDIKRMRRQVHELMRRMGQPVIIKHMFTDKDVQSGLAKPSPNFDNIYAQTRNSDPLSYGIGLVSVEESEFEWISPDGRLSVADDQPAAGFIRAPKYRGFGPGYLTYIIEPDAAQDFFKLDAVGALIRIQQANVQMGWFPQVNDNDLVINAVLDDQGNVIDTSERYQAKMTNPITMRGVDKRGRSETIGAAGNRYLVNQSFPITLVPDNNILMQVDVDR